LPVAAFLTRRSAFVVRITVSFMVCDRSQLLSPYLDGELSAAAAEQVRAHVAGCPACAAELDGLRAVGRLLSAARGGYPADADEVMARLRTHVQSLVDNTDTVLLRIARVFTGVAAAVLIGGLWLLGQPAATGPRTQAAGPVPWDQVRVVLTGSDEIPAAPAAEPTTREAVLEALSGYRGGLAGGAEGELP
jgi:hypothetical protein